MTLVGRIAGLWRYPVKSMAAEELDGAEVSWHGLAGDAWEINRGVGDEEGLSGSTAQAPETEEAGEVGAGPSSQYRVAVR